MECSPSLCANFIANEVSSVRVGMKRIDNPKVIWVNEQASLLDCEYHGSPTDEKSYREHLIQACAFVISEAEPSATYGWADRYGGAGIGKHGGSGRSAIVNGYSLKGVGPTPLIGLGEGFSHCSGGAYLEEAIREVLFSRLLQRILPHGAVPIFAIIDTGLDQAWHLEDRVLLERRVLIVRPFSLRPAHFERAYRYCPRNYAGKLADLRRVQHNFQIFSEAFGVDWLVQQLEACYLNWAEQIAYSTINGLALGTSPSNLNIDGAVLDFGAVSTLPVMANYVTSPGNTLIAEFTKVTESLIELGTSAKNFGGSAFLDFANIMKKRIIDAYESRLLRDLLSRVGLRTCYDRIADSPTAREELIRGFLSYYRQTMRLRVDLLARPLRVTHRHVPALESIWSDNRPASLEGLATTIQRIFPGASLESTHPQVNFWKVTRESLREKITKHLKTVGELDDLNDTISHFDMKYFAQYTSND